SGAYIPSMSQIMADLQQSASAVQLAMTSNLAGMAVGQLAIGPLADRVGRRAPLMISTSLTVAASLACAFAPGLAALITLRFVQGLAGAMGMVLATVLATDLYEGRALLRAFSVLAMIGTIGPVIAPVVGTWLLHFGDWHLQFYWGA